MAITCMTEGCDALPDDDFSPGPGKRISLCNDCYNELAAYVEDDIERPIHIMLINQIAEAERQLDQRPPAPQLSGGDLPDLFALPDAIPEPEDDEEDEEDLEDALSNELGRTAHLVLEQHGVQIHGDRWFDGALHEAYWECDYCPKRSELYRLSITGCLIAARRHVVSEAHLARERELGHTCICCPSPE